MGARSEVGLTPEETRLALGAIAAWRSDSSVPVACPRCGVAGLIIIDRSARPYAEWYALSCAACGLEHALHIPMSPPSGSAD